jgi:hypothetical protein
LIASNRESQLSPEIRQRRDELELAIAKVRDEKPRLKEDEYYSQLERLMLELAQLYDSQN